ncbi:hypothetical protein HNQ60_001707 [Povalibacter uvarum]|uniref:IPT/TIG domain-containing protein n=1 Tax=Povalibacter uvarum TaxID=732238 RepID=A0A841HKC3_9GAMM|nr:IPT/TIG domain-containing protein [Povalibacter uvarum]MBB6092829.1 hypothetical protein [Povalibacter uvarum]
MHYSTGARRVACVALLLSLAACSSGGGSDSETSRQIDLSTSSLTFSAASPAAAAPAAQTITATFSEGVVNVSVLHTGNGIADVVTTVNGTTAQIVVTPAAPSTIGAGSYSGTVAVTAYFCADSACSRLQAGGSRTATVKYQVSPVIDYVAPNVATAGVSATAIIRGIGFSGFPISGVRFGGTAATSMLYISDTEVRAVYPALAAGSYPVSLDIPDHQGAITSTATLIAVDPVTRAAQTLAWPAGVGVVKSLRHDAQRDALLVATDISGGTIVRYPYAGGAWGAPTTAVVTNLQGLSLTVDAAQLLAVANTQVVSVDPETLARGTAIEAPALPTNSFLKSIEVANTNLALITTGIAESKGTELYTLVVRTNAITKLAANFNNGTLGTSADRSVINLVQGDPSLTTAPAVVAFAAGNGGISNTGIAINQNTIGPALDREATRLVLNGLNVYGANYALLGKLPTTTLAVALRPDGKRAFTYDSAAGALLVFDTSTTKNGEALPQVGAAVPLAGAPGAGPKMIISADGRTLFLAGATQLVVQPTPDQ